MKQLRELANAIRALMTTLFVALTKMAVVESLKLFERKRTPPIAVKKQHMKQLDIRIDTSPIANRLQLDEGLRKRLDEGLRKRRSGNSYG